MKSKTTPTYTPYKSYKLVPGGIGSSSSKDDHPSYAILDENDNGYFVTYYSSAGVRSIGGSPVSFIGKDVIQGVPNA